MAEIKWNTAEFEALCVGATMDRLESAAGIVRDEGRRILAGKLKGNWTEHGPYKSGPYASKIWTERYKNEMVKTIRVTKKNDSNSRNVWIMMGTFKTWWAIQMEYGHGNWKGGKRAVLRPALKSSAAAMQNVIENG